MPCQTGLALNPQAKHKNSAADEVSEMATRGFNAIDRPQFKGFYTFNAGWGVFSQKMQNYLAAVTRSVNSF